MCGIIGACYFEPKKEEKKIEKIGKGLDILSHRGEDSYGFMLVGESINNRKGFWFYRTMEKERIIKNLMKIKDYFKFVNFLIVHNRARSIGSINLELAHPIFTENKKIAVIQNGTKRELALYGKSDTYGIYEKYTSGVLVEGNLDRAGVVFILDMEKEKLLFHKDNTRTLMINDENIFASEPIDTGTWLYVKNEKLKNLYEDLFDVEIDDIVEIEKIEKKVCYYCMKDCVSVEEPVVYSSYYGTCNKCFKSPSTSYTYGSNYVNKCSKCNSYLYGSYYTVEDKKYCHYCYDVHFNKYTWR